MQFTFDNENSQNIRTGYQNYENGGMKYLAMFQAFGYMILANFQEILQDYVRNTQQTDHNTKLEKIERGPNISILGGIKYSISYYCHAFVGIRALGLWSARRPRTSKV